MSLYSNEEVCIGCKHAKFHKCGNCFCKCKIEKHINAINGKCEFKVIKTTHKPQAYNN